MTPDATTEATPATPPAPLSIRATLRHTAFRALLGGGSIYFIGNAMQAMAAAC